MKNNRQESRSVIGGEINLILHLAREDDARSTPPTSAKKLESLKFQAIENREDPQTPSTGERAFVAHSPIRENWEAVKFRAISLVDYQRLP
jgi:hypothetical protein